MFYDFFCWYYLISFVSIVIVSLSIFSWYLLHSIPFLLVKLFHLAVSVLNQSNTNGVVSWRICESVHKIFGNFCIQSSSEDLPVVSCSVDPEVRPAIVSAFFKRRQTKALIFPIPASEAGWKKIQPRATSHLKLHTLVCSPSNCITDFIQIGIWHSQFWFQKLPLLVSWKMPAGRNCLLHSLPGVEFAIGRSSLCSHC